MPQQAAGRLAHVQRELKGDLLVGGGSVERRDGWHEGLEVEEPERGRQRAQELAYRRPVDDGARGLVQVDLHARRRWQALTVGHAPAAAAPPPGRTDPPL